MLLLLTTKMNQSIYKPKCCEIPAVAAVAAVGGSFMITAMDQICVK